MSACRGTIDTMRRTCSTQSRSLLDSYRRDYISTSFMYTSPGTWPVLNLASCSATPDVSHYVPHLHLQGSPGPEVRVASMTLFDPQPHPVFHLHNAGFVPCAARKVVLEPAHVSIVIRLSIYTRARTVGISKHAGNLKKSKMSSLYYRDVREIPALELYTVRLKVLSALGMPSTVGSIKYCPARSAT
jgi:hypothetical protein